MPTLAEVHVDQILTNISIAYVPDQFVAPMIAPAVPVRNRSDKYFVYPKEAFTAMSGLRSDGKAVSLRAPGAVAFEGQYSLSTDSYLAEEYAHRTFVTDAERRHSDNPLSPDVDATIFVTQRLYYDNEAMVSTLLLETNNYPASGFKDLVSGAGSAPGDSSWFSTTQANSDPFTNLVNAKLQVLRNVLREPNVFLIDFELAEGLAKHPLYVDRFKYVSMDGITRSGLHSEVLGMRTVVTSLQYNTAAEGQAGSYASMWRATTSGANPRLYALPCWINPEAAGLKSLHMLKTFEAPDQTTGMQGIVVRRYRNEDRKGEYIEASFTRDYKFITVDSNGKNLAGYLIREYR